MLHVPDVRATIAWYESIGFTILHTGEFDGEMSWAELAYGDGRVMFNEGGEPSGRHRREVDLYVQTDAVEERYHALSGRVEVVEGLHDTFYGMREFIIRDINRFWITFGQAIDGGPAGG